MTAVNFSLYEGFIFDMDGTLLDTMPAHLAAWEATAKHFDFPFDAQWLYGLGGMPSAKITTHINKKLGLTLDPDRVAAIQNGLVCQHGAASGSDPRHL